MKPSPSPDERFALPPAAPTGSGSMPGAFQSSEDEQAPAMRILVVEDDFLIAMQTETALLEAGFDVVGIASTAEEAIALARAHRPVLALMDIRLAGERDGIDAAADLFNELEVRCIFATAHDDSATRERARPYAPLGWLSKPYTMVSLVLLVNEALSGPELMPPS